MQGVADQSEPVTGALQTALGAVGSSPIAIELFCGAGGMSLGFEAAGFDVLVAVDNNPIHTATHEWNFPQTHSLCADINDLSAEDLLATAKAQWGKHHLNSSWPDDIDCVFGGPSCQGFSEIGKRNPADERNELIRAFAELVVGVNPKYFVMENVPGLLAPVNEAVLTEALKIFFGANYFLTASGPFVLNAGDFGVPQARRRVFVVGSREDMTPASAPIGNAIKATVAEALSDLRYLDEKEILRTADSVQLSSEEVAGLEQQASPYARSLRSGADLKHGSYGAGYERPWDRTIMTSCGRTVHRDEVIERFQGTAEGAEELISRLPRLRSTGLAPTLRAGTARDHGSFTSARPIHYSIPRVITLREAARLHSFPDWFRFHVTKWHGFQQVGNSVPPILARAVAQVVIEALRVVPNQLPAQPVSRDDKLLSLSLMDAAKHYNIDVSKLPKESRVRIKPKAQRPSSQKEGFV